mgnify:CR=1 FL=1
MAVTLHGFYYSVYTRIAKMVLLEKGIPFDYQEVNPFSKNMPETYLDLHPFRRVPALQHGDFTLIETNAISRYIDGAFEGPALQPADVKATARMDQTLSLIDSYFYYPLIRQVFSNSFFSKQFDEPTDIAELTEGLKAAPTILKALDNIVNEGLVLNSKTVSLADLHLAPMMAYFMMTEEGKALLPNYPALEGWWHSISDRDSLVKTAPAHYGKA